MSSGDALDPGSTRPERPRPQPGGPSGLGPRGRVGPEDPGRTPRLGLHLTLRLSPWKLKQWDGESKASLSSSRELVPRGN